MVVGFLLVLVFLFFFSAASRSASDESEVDNNFNSLNLVNSVQGVIRAWFVKFLPFAVFMFRGEKSSMYLYDRLTVSESV